MLAKTMTYKDYDGAERTETFHFNFSKAELVEMEMGTTGGMEKLMNKIVATRDTKQLIEIFKMLILDSFGEKSADGRRFIKSKELSEGFSQTEAYSDLFMELATDDKAAAAFLNGIIPQGMAEELPKPTQS